MALAYFLKKIGIRIFSKIIRIGIFSEIIGIGIVSEIIHIDIVGAHFLTSKTWKPAVLLADLAN